MSYNDCNDMPYYILENIKANPKYYAFTNENILKAREDSAFMGDIIVANKDLIFMAIQKYCRKSSDLIAEQYRIDKADLLQEARIGMMRAIRKFDISKGYKFSTYAVVIFIRDVQAYLNSRVPTLKLPPKAQDILFKLRKYELQCNKENKEYNLEEACADLGILPESAYKAVRMSQTLYFDDMELLEESEDTCNEAIHNLNAQDYVNIISVELTDIQKQIFERILQGHSIYKINRELKVKRKDISKVISIASEILGESNEI